MNTGSQSMYVLTHGTSLVTIFRSRVFVDATKLRVGPKSDDMCPWKRQTGDTETHREKQPCEDGDGDERAAESQRCLGCQRPPESTGIFSLRASRRTNLANNLTLDLWSRTVQVWNSVVLSHLVCGNSLWQSWEIHTDLGTGKKGPALTKS